MHRGDTYKHKKTHKFFFILLSLRKIAANVFWEYKFFFFTKTKIFLTTQTLGMGFFGLRRRFATKKTTRVKLVALLFKQSNHSSPLPLFLSLLSCFTYHNTYFVNTQNVPHKRGNMENKQKHTHTHKKK